ncbi:MAG: LysR family transcriptional regulator [Bacteroidetes bacterium]|nr:LysR family transcriptional regulator [Bacteroidota bacterium]MCL4817433.1 winged helix-turn-helix domain-containing protein [Flavobacteriales bacterium]NOG96107.1 LysR family transcriptional regulator [Bacteroidota bacterium]
MLMKKNYTIRTRIWIDEKEGPFLGIGRVVLLEKIQQTGSITRAAKEIKMSYRQAWQLVEDMNQRAEQPLVEKILGGKNGGGAILTNTGEKAIKTFYALEQKVKKFVATESKELKF